MFEDEVMWVRNRLHQGWKFFLLEIHANLCCKLISVLSNSYIFICAYVFVGPQVFCACEQGHDYNFYSMKHQPYGIFFLQYMAFLCYHALNWFC